MIQIVLSRMFEEDIQAWHVFDAFATARTGTDTELEVRAVDVAGEALLAARPKIVPYGLYALELDVLVSAGRVLIGVQDMLRNTWIAQGYADVERPLKRLDFRPPLTLGPIRIVVSAGNDNTPGPVDFRLISARVSRERGLFGYIEENVADGVVALRRTYRVSLLPRLLRARLAAAKIWMPGDWRIVGISDIGHATRGITVARNGAGHQFIVTADVGDDTCSVIENVGCTQRPRGIVQFPDRAAPMFLLPHDGADGTRTPLVFAFNFDREGVSVPNSDIRLMTGVFSVGPGQVSSIDEVGSPSILTRPGAWGYRGGAVGTDKQGRKWYGVVDRDQSLFHVLSEDLLVAEDGASAPRIKLPGHFEPIGVAAMDGLPDADMPVFVINSRHQGCVASVFLNENGTPKGIELIEIAGRSRSSVVHGRFSPDHPNGHLALALWGGDPEDLNSTTTGQVLLFRVGPDGSLHQPRYIRAGIHPTDIAIGDLDGDGLDELVVLNYGNGLGAADREVLGDVQILKFQDGDFHEISVIKLPSPRIACCADLDGDGVDELLISLFFERKMVTLKKKATHLRFN